MELALLLPVHNNLAYTKTTVEAVAEEFGKIADHTFRLIVIDDGSTDGTSEWVRAHHPATVLLHGEGNLWWSGAINMGAKYAMDVLHADYLILWNNDIQFEKDYFHHLCHILSGSDHQTIYGSKILIKEQPGLVWSMGGYFNPKTGAFGMHGYYDNDGKDYRIQKAVDWLTGMGTIIPRQAVEQIGYWDSQHFPQYHGDSDFTWRAKMKGIKIMVHPELLIYNNVSSTGIEHGGSIKSLLRTMTDLRSKTNFRVNLSFYRLHADGLRAYVPFLASYLKVFGGFFKWRLLGWFGIRKKIHYK
jgi:GT2 family glycosyltransferase